MTKTLYTILLLMLATYVQAQTLSISAGGGICTKGAITFKKSSPTQIVYYPQNPKQVASPILGASIFYQSKTKWRIGFMLNISRLAVAGDTYFPDSSGSYVITKRAKYYYGKSIVSPGLSISKVGHIRNGTIYIGLNG